MQHGILMGKSFFHNRLPLWAAFIGHLLLQWRLTYWLPENSAALKVLFYNETFLPQVKLAIISCPTVLLEPYTININLNLIRSDICDIRYVTWPMSRPYMYHTSGMQHTSKQSHLYKCVLVSFSRTSCISYLKCFSFLVRSLSVGYQFNFVA